MRKARVVFRKSDGLCLQDPRRPPCFATREQLSDERVIERLVIPQHGGAAADFVVVELEYPGKQPPWDFKWTPEGLAPATDDTDAVKAWRIRGQMSPILRRIRKRRMEQDLVLAREAGDEEAAAYIEEELRR